MRNECSGILMKLAEGYGKDIRKILSTNEYGNVNKSFYDLYEGKLSGRVDNVL